MYMIIKDMKRLELNTKIRGIVSKTQTLKII